jgi:aminomethyltransferase
MLTQAGFDEVRASSASGRCLAPLYNSFVPIGSAFHTRTAPLAESLSFRDWAGYYAVSSFETHHDHEYNAIRNACALIDISPLFKYRVEGPDATRLVNRIITREASRLAVGRVWYTPWCDDEGKVIDDGTVTRLAPETYRWTAAHPNLRWLVENATGLTVEVEEISEQLAGLALQGPTSRALLRSVCTAPVDTLKYFRVATGEIAGVPVDVSRTGYTGDLGYEIWMPWDRAVAVWDALAEAGRAFDLHAAGMLALDVARVEAGLLLIDVDFQSSRKALIESQKYSPFELGLGRLVDLSKPAFVGRRALIHEHRRGHPRQIVGLELEWTAVEALYEAVGLPPAVAAQTSRVAVPVYRGSAQVGRATSTTWSTTLKKMIALATIDRPHYAIGSRVEMEVTVEAVRHRAPATVVPTPFFSPARKTA